MFPSISDLVCLRATSGWVSSLVLLLALCASLSATGQSADELKERREALLEEIQANNRRLTDTRKNKAATLEQITLLQSQIRNREELVATLQSEIAFTENSINRTVEVIDALTFDVQRLEKEYVELLRAAYRAHLQNSWLSFILSSDSFNEAFRRWQYFRQYQRFRTRQARLILATQRTLSSKLEQLETRRVEKADLLRSEQQQQVALGRERNAQNQLLGRLKRSESNLLAELRKQEKAREELSTAIERAITAEVERIRRADRAGTRPATPSNKTENAAAEVPADASNFASLRGRLPWPVTNGTVARPFGRQAHPTVPNVEISNNGVDIAVSGSTAVNVVADGIVVSKHFVPGYRNMVLIRHGDFYTVYSNLESLSVKSGDKVSVGQTIGQVNREAGELHFEVWRQKERLNPENWIRRR